MISKTCYDWYSCPYWQKTETSRFLNPLLGSILPPQGGLQGVTPNVNLMAQGSNYTVDTKKLHDYAPSVSGETISVSGVFFSCIFSQKFTFFIQNKPFWVASCFQLPSKGLSIRLFFSFFFNVSMHLGAIEYFGLWCRVSRLWNAKIFPPKIESIYYSPP